MDVLLGLKAKEKSPDPTLAGQMVAEKEISSTVVSTFSKYSILLSYSYRSAVTCVSTDMLG